MASSNTNEMWEASVCKRLYSVKHSGILRGGNAWASGFKIAKTSVRSPQNLFIYTIIKKVSGSKYPTNIFSNFEKGRTGVDLTACTPLVSVQLSGMNIPELTSVFQRNMQQHSIQLGDVVVLKMRCL